MSTDPDMVLVSPSPGAGDAVTINPDSGNIVVADDGNPLNGMRFVSNGELPRGGWDSRGVMPEPRIGFAYDVFGSHSTTSGKKTQNPMVSKNTT